MKTALITTVSLLLTSLTAQPPQAQDPPVNRPAVLTGIDVLIRDEFAPLKGKRVGLVTNPTGVTGDLKATVDVLASAPGVKLVALFGPEHGVRGDALAGETVGNAKDPRTGLTVYSLYGKTKKPTAAMLRNVDALVFDMQDIGSRSYTYITTMGLCMEAAADAGIPFYVLDRPNPIGGQRVEGNLVESGFKSGVSPYPIAYCHGMTMGELAQMLNGRGMLAGGRKCDLRVIRMQGYRRSMRWEQTGLPWVPTSPHVPKPETAYFYAATGITGELPTVSIGVGYTLPFELCGAPGISPHALADALNRRKLAGFFFRPISYRPFYALFQGQTCGGVQIYLIDPDRAELTRLNFELLDAIRKVAPRTLFKDSSRMFDLVCGTDRVRKMFQAGRRPQEIWAAWNSSASAFRTARQPYLIYP
jgi:uncharacterized protein YbbC (DUF1343 family)